MKRLLLPLLAALLVSAVKVLKTCRDLSTGKITGIEAYEKLGKPDMWSKDYCRQYMRLLILNETLTTCIKKRVKLKLRPIAISIISCNLVWISHD